VMYLGKIVESGSPRDVLQHPAHPYTQALCDVSPRRHDNPSSGPREVIGGEPPNAAEVPRGCRFHPRCKFAQDRCQVEEPQLKVLAGSQTLQQAACLLLE
jgi:oligopeptide/dipeptide ABC transporter ATP-binding protein